MYKLTPSFLLVNFLTERWAEEAGNARGRRAQRRLDTRGAEVAAVAREEEGMVAPGAEEACGE